MLTEREKQWLTEREKLLRVNGCYSYEFFMMQEEKKILRDGFWVRYQTLWRQMNGQSQD